jgi:uncharacterized phage-like protein YoqJ
MKEKTCLFTGHREIEPAKYVYIRNRLVFLVTQAVEDGITDFCAGGAIGFDTLAAQVVLEQRAKNPAIKPHLVLPCKEQARNWSYINKENYNDILAAADTVTYVSEHYTSFCMQLRNREMVNRSSRCICYLERNKGGTQNTVKYAEKNGLKIVNVIE